MLIKIKRKREEEKNVSRACARILFNIIYIYLVYSCLGEPQSIENTGFKILNITLVILTITLVILKYHTCNTSIFLQKHLSTTLLTAYPQIYPQIYPQEQERKKREVRKCGNAFISFSIEF